jgi:hypothetical protein
MLPSFSAPLQHDSLTSPLFPPQPLLVLLKALQYQHHKNKNAYPKLSTPFPNIFLSMSISIAHIAVH